MINKHFVKVLFCLLGFAGAGYSQTLAADRFDLSFVSWFINSPPAHIDVNENFLYVSATAFVIVDISDETNPNIVSQLRPLEPGMPASLVVDDNYAYVYWTKQGLRTIDISDKNHPKIKSTYSSSYEYRELYLSYPFLYTFAEIKPLQYHLHIFDVSDPDTLALIGDFDFAELGLHSRVRTTFSMEYSSVLW